MREMWISASEAMEMAQVSRQLIYAWRKRNQIRYRRSRRPGMKKYEYEYPLSELKRMLTSETSEVVPSLARKVSRRRRSRSRTRATS